MAGVTCSTADREWSTAKWRTAIQAKFLRGEDGEADVADDAAIVRRGQVLAGLGVVGLAVALAVLPMLVAFGVATGAVASAGVWLGSLVAIGGGVKAAAVILGAAGFVLRPRRVLAASSD